MGIIIREPSLRSCMTPQMWPAGSMLKTSFFRMICFVHIHLVGCALRSIGEWTGQNTNADVNLTVN